MRGYLLDTNIVVYWLDQGRPQHNSVSQYIQELPPESPLMISAITLGEIEYGLCVVSENTTSQHETFRELVDRQLPMVLDVTKTTRLYYGLLRARVFEKYAPREKRRQGLRPEQLIDPITSCELGIQENDLWLAAQALEYNLVLVSNDTMRRIRDISEEIEVENWAR